MRPSYALGCRAFSIRLPIDLFSDALISCKPVEATVNSPIGTYAVPRAIGRVVAASIIMPIDCSNTAFIGIARCIAGMIASIVILPLP